MCLIVLAWKASPQYKLILAANRDEFFARSTATACFRDGVLAGKDLQAGGTWLGVSRQGRVAAITNFRSVESPLSVAKSRGILVDDFLTTELSAKDYINQVRSQREVFRPFNLLLYDGLELICFNSVTNRIDTLEPGIHTLSNHYLNSAWPKQKQIQQSLSDLLDDRGLTDIEPDDLFEIMADKTQASDSDLPETGISLEWEKHLSSIFITGEDYGTRSTSALLLTNERNLQFMEKTHTPSQPGKITCNERFRLKR